MTRKDLISIISSYQRLIEEKEDLEKFVDGKKINNLEIAKKVISSVAKNTDESCGIWICIGTFKAHDSNDDILDRYYCFIDLETCKEMLVPSLEYGEFCRKNSVIMLDKYFEMYDMEPFYGLEGFKKFRELFISSISFYLINAELPNINIDNFSKYYSRKVDNYKIDGNSTLEPISFTRR